ncbi:LysR family transcriptional regulator [Pollutimonas nitritireducens]|uniref:LysR family transcriptional regulator n=1 Tax=Pollutimonas nitritireducens TaxID=2045209 RepID=A0A2N4UI94_9BURK|nr:LysR family transcriptional regulator [Pollutimonas nitritireducens]PLC54742.1 LysR family transcriptional regulator [Pollutimonas nitritireducens]
MDTLLSLRVFCEIADAGSFVGAADRLSLSAPMVSKHLAHLERELGVRLLNRTSRRVSLTEAGSLYLEQCRSALEMLELAAATIGSSVEAPRGNLKITAPVWFANPRVVGVLAAYQKRYPDVILDLRFSNRKVDLAAEGYDLALRVTRDPSPHLIVRKICAIHFYLVATPGYFDSFGVPETISALANYGGILPSYLGSEGFEFDGPKGKVLIRLNPVMRSDDSTYSYHAVRAGVGIGYMPGWLVDDDLAAGHLIQVLPQYHQAPRELYATYTSRKYLTPKVRTFIDFVTEALGDPRL